MKQEYRNRRFGMFRTAMQVVLLLGLTSVSGAAPRRSSNFKLDVNYLKAMLAHRKLETRLSRAELKTITTIGIMNGALEAEKEMGKHLTELVADLILNTDKSNKEEIMPKVLKIEEALERDKNVIQILTAAMDLATKSLTMKEYKEQLQRTLDEHKNRKREIVSEKDVDLDELKTKILDHVHHMQKRIPQKIESTLDYLRKNEELDMVKINRKRSPQQPVELPNIIPVDRVEDNLVVSENPPPPVHDSSKDVNITVNVGPNDIVEISETNGERAENQFELSEEDDDAGGGGGAMPGGILGIITSLSGGEGGSDIGALLGALTGLVSQIFGPGGLDIETLISTGTTLIAGLLAGDRNFGTVLGEYVGTAFDGLSGGGGAINNGKFLGNLLGTIAASLSADPEDEDQSPQPMLFIRTLIQSFGEAKNRRGPTTDDEGEQTPVHPPPPGSDSFGFIKQIASALVGGITSLILNASLGASGGSSQASTAVLTSSSHPQPAPKPTW